MSNLLIISSAVTIIWALCGSLVWVGLTAPLEFGDYIIEEAKLSRAQRNVFVFLCGPLVWPIDLYRYLLRTWLAFWRALGHPQS